MSDDADQHGQRDDRYDVGTGPMEFLQRQQGEDDGEGELGRAEPLPEETEDPHASADETGVAPPDIGMGDDNLQSDQQEVGETGENATGEDEGSSGAGGGDIAQDQKPQKTP